MDNALAIAARFAISLDEMLDSKKMREWIKDLGLMENSSLLVVLKKSNDIEDHANPTTVVPDITQQPVHPPNIHKGQILLLKRMTNLQRSCEEAAHDITSSNLDEMSEEASSTMVQRYAGLLRLLQTLEADSGEEMFSVSTYHSQHVKVYERLIEMAPVFQRKNPLISQLPSARKNELTKKAKHSNVIPTASEDYD